ncbi:serine-enriched protein-like isoform X2 [Mytilus galloprovincialis]|uniref:serine-enriched protein-like isoform X2 n=1 Tax=Mytilus galloprovincialis TaxID=29158 RepID=UPI003F7CBEF2
MDVYILLSSTYSLSRINNCSSGYGSSQDLSDSEAVTANDTVDTPDREHIGHTSRSINSILNTRMGHWTSSTSMSFRNTQTLTEHLRTISYIPQLCDVIFEVGPEKVKVHGVKAILGTRSRVLYNLILKKQKEQEFKGKTHKKDKKKKTSSIFQNDVLITVQKYQPEDFRKIIEFIHCGSVDINSSCLAGLLCGASQFGLDDLEKACWDFVNYCVKNGTVLSLLPSAKRYCNFKLGQILMEKIFCSVRRTVTV